MENFIFSRDRGIYYTQFGKTLPDLLNQELLSGAKPAPGGIFDPKNPPCMLNMDRDKWTMDHSITPGHFLGFFRIQGYQN